MNILKPSKTSLSLSLALHLSGFGMQEMRSSFQRQFDCSSAGTLSSVRQRPLMAWLGNVSLGRSLEAAFCTSDWQHLPTQQVSRLGPGVTQ